MSSGTTCFLLLLCAPPLQTSGVSGDPCWPDQPDATLGKCLNESARALLPLLDALPEVVSTALPEVVLTALPLLTWNRTDELAIDLCCHRLRIRGESFTLSPLDFRNHSGWQFRKQPSLRLKFLRPNSGEDVLHTVAGIELSSNGSHDRPFVFWLVSNVRGGDLTTGHVLFDYVAPGVYGDRNLILLLEQGSAVTDVDPSLYDRRTSATCQALSELEGRCLWDVGRFVADFDLKIVGATSFKVTSLTYVLWRRLEVGADEPTECARYTESFPRATVVNGELLCPRKNYQVCDPQKLRRDWPDACLEMIEQEFRKLKLLDARGRLQAIMLLAFEYSSAFGFRACCRRRTVTSSVTWINVLDVRRHSAATFRQLPQFHFRPRRGYTFRENVFYSMMVIDTFSPGRKSPNQFPFLNFLKINIRGSDVRNSGDVVVEYVPPTENHLVAFVFYEQSAGRKDDFDVSLLSRRPCFLPDAANSCAFDLVRAVTFFGWKTVAASKIHPRKDGFAIFQQIEMGLPEAEICHDNYGTPTNNDSIVCPDDCRVSNKLPACLSASKESLIETTALVADDLALQVALSMTLPERRNVTSDACCLRRTESSPEMTLNPLTDVRPSLFQLYQDSPTFTFAWRSDFADSSGYFSLAMIDTQPSSFGGGGVERPFIHFLSINILDLSRRFRLGSVGHTVIAYLSPHTLNKLHVILYRQPGGRIENFQEVADIYVNTEPCPMSNRRENCFFKLGHFVSGYSLQLVSVLQVWPGGKSLALASQERHDQMGWDGIRSVLCPEVGAPTDEAGKFVCRTGIDVCSRERVSNGARDCLFQVKGEFLHRLSANHFDMSSRLSVFPLLSFRSELLEFDVCCKQSSARAGSVEINPLEEKEYEASLLRFEPEVEFFSAEGNNFENGDNKLYTLATFAVDEDEPFGTREFPLVHWIVANIRGLDILTGRTIVPYVITAEHRRYVTLVFSQEVEIEEFELNAYSTTPCTNYSEIYRDRCKFSLSQFMFDYVLEIIGGVHFVPKEDDYTSYVAINHLRVPISAFCMGHFRSYVDVDAKNRTTCRGNGKSVPVMLTEQEQMCHLDNENDAQRLTTSANTYHTVTLRPSISTSNTPNLPNHIFPPFFGGGVSVNYSFPSVLLLCVLVTAISLPGT